MRISSSMFFQTGVNTINTQQAGLMKVYQQIGTGKRMLNPSDDPLAAAQTINIAQSQSLNLRYTENRQVAKNALGAEENTLTSVTSLMTSIKTRLVEAGNGVLSDADRATLSNVLSNSRENLLALANATDGNGQYLFSGHKGSQPPFIEDANGRISYQGDDGRRKIQVDQTRQLDGADTGKELFMQAAPGTRNYLTSSAPSNTGSASVGAPTIIKGDGEYIGNAFEISITAVGTDLFYSASRLDASGNPVPPASAPQPITDKTTSLNLFDQVQVKFSGTPAAGDTFKVEPSFVKGSYGLDGLIIGSGSSLEIGTPAVVDATDDYAGKVIAVAFTAANKYEVTVDGVTTGPFDYTYDPSIGDTLSLEGVQIKLGGIPEAGDKFTLQPVTEPATNLNVFDALDSLITALENPLDTPAAAAQFRNQLNATMQRIDMTYNQVLTVRSSVGTRMNEIESIDANASLRNLSYAQDLIRLEDLDWYEATAQLKMQTAALEAASMAFKQIQATSLFNLANR